MYEDEAAAADKYCKECVQLEEERDRLKRLDLTAVEKHELWCGLSRRSERLDDLLIRALNEPIPASAARAQDDKRQAGWWLEYHLKTLALEDTNA